jgi:hypothetical protein
MLRKTKDLGFAGNRSVGTREDNFLYQNHRMRVDKARKSDTLNSFFMNTTTNYVSDYTRDKQGESRHIINVGHGGGGSSFKPNVSKRSSHHNWNTGN